MISPATTPKRLRDRLLVGIIAVIVMSVAIALLVWASRPRWHTTLSPVNPELGVALSVQYPDGWEQQGLMDKANGWEADLWETAIMRGAFMRQPPQGLSRWVQEHLFKQDFSESKRDNFDVVMDIDELGIDDYLKSAEAGWRQDLNYKTSVRRFQHALGPALELNRLPRRNPSSQMTVLPSRCGVIIFCKDPARHRKMHIIITAYGREGVQVWPEWDEVVRRIRLVPGR